MMTYDDQALIQARFTEQFANDFGKIYTCNDANIIICELTKAYVPIDEFMNVLKKKAEIIEKHGCEKFIFDKRELRGFHQPSMEWYYLTWKPEMYRKFGLSKHRKLFTTEEWFLKCIQAGRNEIKRKDPGNIVHTLDIKVCQTLDEAVES